MAPGQIISEPLAQSVAELSSELGRQVGLTLNRKGRVEHVIVGDAHSLFIPDLGRARAGARRFRGVRLVHTQLRGEGLSGDDLTDLARLHLDLVGVLALSPEGRVLQLHYAHLLPAGGPEPYAQPEPLGPREPGPDFLALITDLEAQFARESGSTIEADAEAKAAVRAVAVHVSVDSRLDARESLRELTELARTAGVVLVDAIIQNRRAYDPKFVMGRGKLDELLLRTMQLDCELVIFDQDLAPHQLRAIADVTETKVIDRSQLILDIFAQRAHTREGKLAVELAMLRYQLPRLVGKSTALSRLMGGIGGRGPGESKLEQDRRRARERIHWLATQLETTQVQRANRRSRRKRAGVPIVALVGYTNAGKSTLFNALTRSEVLAEDKLFATLHTTTRRLRFPQERELVLVDTVGFIRDLPEDLIVAFKATLEELHEADLLLHVIDAGDARLEQQIESVERVLEEMELLDVPRLRVFNKIDLLPEEFAENLCRSYQAYGLSALDRASTRPLMRALESRLWQAGVLAAQASFLEWSGDVEPVGEALEDDEGLD